MLSVVRGACIVTSVENQTINYEAPVLHTFIASQTDELIILLGDTLGSRKFDLIAHCLASVLISFDGLLTGCRYAFPVSAAA